MIASGVGAIRSDSYLLLRGVTDPGQQIPHRGTLLSSKRWMEKIIGKAWITRWSNVGLMDGFDKFVPFSGVYASTVPASPGRLVFFRVFVRFGSVRFCPCDLRMDSIGLVVIVSFIAVVFFRSVANSSAFLSVRQVSACGARCSSRAQPARCGIGMDREANDQTKIQEHSKIRNGCQTTATSYVLDNCCCCYG